MRMMRLMITYTSHILQTPSLSLPLPILSQITPTLTATSHPTQTPKQSLVFYYVVRSSGKHLSPSVSGFPPSRLSQSIASLVFATEIIAVVELGGLGGDPLDDDGNWIRY